MYRRSSASGKSRSQPLDDLYDHLPILAGNPSKYACKVLSLIARATTCFGQQVSNIAVKDVGQLHQPRNIGHDESSLDARHRLITYSQLFSNLLLRQIRRNAVSRYRPSHHPCQSAQVRTRHTPSLSPRMVDDQLIDMKGFFS